MPRKAFLVALFACVSCTASTDSATREDQQRMAVDSLVNAAVGNDVPGIAVAVVRAGTVVYASTRGVARRSPDIPVTDSTPFQLASTTKTLSATALLTLVRDKQISLDQPIGDLLADLPQAWRPIPVRRLLSHTSGLPDIVRETGTNTLVGETWEDAFKIVSIRPLEFTVGSRWAYNQTNYALLLRIIEAVSHQRFEPFMQERIFGPTGMRNASFPAMADPSTRCAENYERGAEGTPIIRSLAFPSFVHSAAGLCASLSDLLRFNAALDSGRVLSADLMNAMWTPMPVDSGRVAEYGLGWVVDETNGHRFVGHSGGNATAYRRYLNDSLTVIVLSNGKFDPDQLAGSIATVFLSGPDRSAVAPAERLWDAARSGDVAGVSAALDAGADVNALDQRRTKSGRRALNWAAIGDHADVIALLLKRGAQIDAANNTGFTALHHAAESGSLRAVRTLLAAGASRALKTVDGERPADTARRKGHAEIAALLEGAP